MLAGFVHQQGHFTGIEEGWRTAAPMQLNYFTAVIKQLALHLDFAHQLPVRFRATTIGSDYLVTSTVVTNGITKRDMEVQRQRACGVALLRLIAAIISS